MKKVFIILCICLFTSNVNAGVFTFAAASSAKSAARRAESEIEETQKEVKNLKNDVRELREKVEELIKILEKQNEEKETEKINQQGKSNS